MIASKVDEVSHRLREAAGTGEVITIVYDGGSQPGAKREIMVNRLRRDGKVEAIDLQTHSAKTFFVSKIIVVAADHPAASYDANVYRASRAPGGRKRTYSTQRHGLWGWLKSLFGH